MPHENHSYDYSDVEPSKFLVDNLGLLPEGRVLDVAMGNGRNAVYLARMGFSVEGVDISEEAVRKALNLAASNRVTIEAETADLEKGYSIKPDTYDLMICFNYLQRNLVPQMKAGLKKGGMIVYETYIIDQAQFGRPRNPDFLLKHNELLDLFRDFRCLRYREGLFNNSKAIASLIAEKIDR
jgi:2-polyprenyl-3-methyl-5-hydroxy-6-metoxy-1,4-benzoquinol methylase